MAIGQLSLKQLPKIQLKFGKNPQFQPGGLTLTVMPDNGPRLNNNSELFTLSLF
ncbi:conserved protein of unknown function [Limnospira indica PCC 8005]|uniref:Uncharacterized protein n=1 Tax=Limnospira indica PCC 8005 TaxID=376219 RepID=A0A9P1NZN4_9CYAN|nr:conserved protein of unknown function [Limnospira indica PCC 8005]